MDAPEPEETGSWLQRRGTDLAVWGLVVVAVIGFAASAAWLATRARFEFREAVPSAAPPEDAAREADRPVPAPPVQTVQTVPAAPAAPSAAANAGATWVTQPAPIFPERALAAGVPGGSAEVSCVAEVSGQLSQCRIVGETPAGYDFGANAVAAASEGRVRPRRVDGVAVRSKISFTIRYRPAP